LVFGGGRGRNKEGRVGHHNSCLYREDMKGGLGCVSNVFIFLRRIGEEEKGGKKARIITQLSARVRGGKDLREREGRREPCRKTVSWNRAGRKGSKRILFYSLLVGLEGEKRR